jgi:hypothetical protein
MGSSPKKTVEERLRLRKKTCGIMLLAWILAAFKNGLLENGFHGEFLDPLFFSLGEMPLIAMVAAFPAYVLWQPFRKTSPFPPLWAAVLALWYACSLSFSVFK